MITRLHDAAADPKGYEEVKRLIEIEHLDVNAVHPQHKTKPILFAAQSGSLATLKYLIEGAGADLDGSRDEKNILFFAQQNTPDIADYLTNPANQIIERLNCDVTYSQAAAMLLQLERLSDIYRDNPASIFKEDREGRSALYWLAFYNVSSTVCFFTMQPQFIYYSSVSKLDSILRGYGDAAYHLGTECQQTNDIAKSRAFAEACRCYQQIKEKSNRDIYKLAKGLANLGLCYYEQDKLAEAAKEVSMSLQYFARIKGGDIAERIESSERLLTAIKTEMAAAKEFKSWGFQSKDVANDGDYFFHAAVDQLKKHNISLTHSELRAKTAKHVSDHIQEYEAFMEDERDLYLSKLKKAGTWPDHIAILAFSRAFNVTVAILQSDGAGSQVFKRPEATATLYLGYIVPVHYQSLHLDEKMTPEKSIQADIDRAEPDAFQCVSALKRLHSAIEQTKAKYTNGGAGTMFDRRLTLNTGAPMIDKKGARVLRRTQSF